MNYNWTHPQNVLRMVWRLMVLTWAVSLVLWNVFLAIWITMRNIKSFVDFVENGI